LELLCLLIEAGGGRRWASDSAASCDRESGGGGGCSSPLVEARSSLSDRWQVAVLASSDAHLFHVVTPMIAIESPQCVYSCL
jgi:hypothetical protein